MPDKLKRFYEFEEFRLDARNLCLWRSGEIVLLPPKALETLLLLVEKSGEIVSREELLDTVWKNTFVEEGNINYTISLLRKSLGGKQFIQTVPKRGYRFAADVRLISSEQKGVQEKDLQIIEKAVSPEINDDAALPTENIALAELEKISLPPRPQKPNRLLFLSLAAAAFFCVLFLLVGFGFWRQNRETGTAETPHNSEMQFERLTDTGDIAYLAISPDGEFVALNRGGDDVYLKDLRSNGEVKLNLEQRAERVGGLRFSPDSRFIFFCDNMEQKTAGKIYQASRFGGTVRVVAENVWTGFSVSPDGRFLAFVRKFPAENKSVLIVKNLEDKSEKEYAPRILPEEYYWNNYPAWLADGSKIAMVVVSRTEHFLSLLAVDLANGGEEEIRIPQFRNVEQILWSADGKSFIASANAGNNFQIWQIGYPGGELRRITNDLNSYLGISMTADGKKLLARQRIYYSNIWVGNSDAADNSGISNFRQLTVGTSRNDGLKGLTWLNSEKVVYTSNAEKLRDWNLWAVDVSADTRQELTFDRETQNEAPAASPDGKIIYFTSNRSTTAHIWQVGSDGSDARPVTSGETENELYPQISRDGVWCYFIQKNHNVSSIWRKSLIDETRQKLTDEKTLSPDTFLSLSPDGKSLAFQNLAAEGQNKNRKEELSIAVLNTENPESKIQFFNFPATSQYFGWDAGGEALDYVDNTGGGAFVWRRKLKGDAKPTLIFNFPKEFIFNFAWSKDGRQIAVARGQLLRDAVLLANF